MVHHDANDVRHQFRTDCATLKRQAPACSPLAPDFLQDLQGYTLYQCGSPGIFSWSDGDAADDSPAFREKSHPSDGLALQVENLAENYCELHFFSSFLAVCRTPKPETPDVRDPGSSPFQAILLNFYRFS